MKTKPAAVAALLFLPFTAMLHHAVFFRPTCMLNPFGEDYTLAVMRVWLSQDPSPYLGLVAALGAFFVLRRFAWLTPYALAFFFAFLPLSIWIWDIPFSGRVVCALFHDQKGPIPIYSRYFYIFGATVFAVAAVAIALHRRSRLAVSASTAQ